MSWRCSVRAAGAFRVRKYMKNARKDEPDSEARQRWLTFLRNHLGEAWPHQGLGGRPPKPTDERNGDAPSSELSDGLVATPVLGGLHHVYRRKAA